MKPFDYHSLNAADWNYVGGVSTLPMQTPAERWRERYEARQRVIRKRAARRLLASHGITNVVVRDRYEMCEG